MTDKQCKDICWAIVVMGSAINVMIFVWGYMICELLHRILIKP